MIRLKDALPNVDLRSRPFAQLEGANGAKAPFLTPAQHQLPTSLSWPGYRDGVRQITSLLLVPHLRYHGIIPVLLYHIPLHFERERDTDLIAESWDLGRLVCLDSEPELDAINETNFDEGD